MTEVPSEAKPGKRKSFRDFCVFDSWKDLGEDGRTFVGIRVESGCPEIHFPMGYAEGVAENLCDAELKRDFLRIVALLSDKALPDYFAAADLEKCRLDFPLHAFLGVLEYYRDFGYFVENETVYRKNISGKISWERTVKNVRPQVVRGEDGRHRVVYLKLVTGKSCHREDAQITLVHKFCVYEAARLVGPLLDFSEADIEFPELGFDAGLFEEILHEKLGATFNDRSLELFRNLLTVTEFLAKKETFGNEGSANLFGVNTFAPVWEMMVDRTFGNLPENFRKKDFDPHCRWNLGSSREYENPNYAMRPDTVLWDGDSGRLLVLDAKFYRFGLSGKAFDLPSSESICKQIAYAEFAERLLGKLSVRPEKIYNAFVMPYCAENVPENLPGDEESPGRIFKMRFVGFCYGNWKSFETGEESYRSYHEIAGILLDFKSLLRNGADSAKAGRALSGLVAAKIPAKTFTKTSCQKSEPRPCPFFRP